MTKSVLTKLTTRPLKPINEIYKYNELKFKFQILAEILTKICLGCKIEKPLEEFYRANRSHDGRAGRCTECVKAQVTGRYWENMWETDHRVRAYPGQYTNDWQRENTANILMAMGWKHNEENNIWYKLPMKNKFGEWPISKRRMLKELKRKEKKKYTDHTIITNMKIKLQSPPENYTPKKKNDRSIDNETMNEIRKLYTTDRKMSQPKLAEMFKVSQSYINKIIHYKV